MEEMIGVVKWTAGQWCPRGFMWCDGQRLEIQRYQALYAVIGNAYGGDYHSYFNLPDLREKGPDGRPIPFQPGKLKPIICVVGMWPDRED